MADDIPEGGESVCWLERVCPECGLLVEADLPAVCERCGAAVPSDATDSSAERTVR